MTRRRVLFALAAASAMPWAVTVYAQQKIPKIGGLFFGNPEPAATQLRDAMRHLGYIDKKNVELDFRSAGGNAEAAASIASEFARMNVDVIVAAATGAVKAAMQATKTIPIVMAPAGAPVETGLVASLNRPGGNVTGVSSTHAELGAKTLELMREILPALRRVAVLVNADDALFGKFLLGQVERAGRAMKIDVHGVTLQRGQLDRAFASIAKDGVQAVIAQPSLPREQVAELAIKHRLPVVSPTPLAVEVGAFMSYGGTQAETNRQAALCIDRILKGAKPATMAVEQPTRFELVLNLKTARAIGLNVPPSVLARADRIVE